MLKKIPIGIDDFKKLRTNDYFYIDKTKFIEEILNDGAEVKLFTRPRRFGKTLNMSMLKYLFDIRESDENRKLFDNLYIKNSSVFSEQGKYPVIFISMKEIKGTTWEEMQKSIRRTFSNLYEEYKYLRESLDERNKRKFEKIWFDEIDGSYDDALNFLSKILEEYYKEKVVVLIDEYDAPLTMAYEYNFYDRASVFFKEIYGSVLKTNLSLKMGVLTGAIRVAQAGIFSDLNNLKINTILSETYDECFGLTEKEVEKVLKEFDLDYKMDEVKSWYDGYKFGNVEIYNPWSILNYTDEKKLKAYWINTSGNVLIKDLLVRSDKTTFDNLEKLLNGEEKMVFINESIAIGHTLSPNNLWELMLFSGYLTIKEKISENTYLVKIPNKEIQSFFKILFVDIIFNGVNNSITSMKEALHSKNIPYIMTILENVVINAMSFYDVSKKYENPYQTLLAGFLYGLDDFYEMKSNIETGYGRADIILKPRNKNWAGYIFELKRAKTKDLEKEADKALEQIENKKYDTLLKTEGIKEIIKIGLVFDGKKVEFKYCKD